MKTLLAIDTSTECASIALMHDQKIACQEQGAQRNHARLLLPMIESLLAEAGLHLSQLDAIVFGRGPGSFTGLRIACSVAKGLAYAQDLPLYPVSSLAAIANEALKQGNNPPGAEILAVLDARMNQLYWAHFTNHQESTNEQVTAASDLCVNSTAPLILAGVGYETYLAQLPLSVRNNIQQHHTIYPRAEAMIRLVLTEKVNAVSAADALPIYIRNQITQGVSRG